MAKPQKAAKTNIRTFSYFYLISALLLVTSNILFHPYIKVRLIGISQPDAIGSALRYALIAIPLIIFFRLRRLKKDAFITAISYHIFFMTNSLLAFLSTLTKNPSLNPIIEIAARSESDNLRIRILEQSVPKRLFIFTLSLIVGIVIIRYLCRNASYFK